MTNEQTGRPRFLLDDITSFQLSKAEIVEREDVSYRALVAIMLGRDPTTMSREEVAHKLLSFAEYCHNHFESVEARLYQLCREIDAEKGEEE